eukprot:CAMPEP_0198701144 /NCGR_PEP_ID=MMETSP1468-20131203/380293_1 /TAXON_ID=1461545 /ORGANISM="Mantoniella sp, Strain CCMP1436" /LENGTH=285 /DNA_ID=CAMNT_0044459347 /DNA_START=131 /DNA_END=988 /DNA_ORIENTATION=+
MAPSTSTSTWEVKRHLEGSSSHKTNVPWTEYWTTKTGKNLPLLCPGCGKDENPEGAAAHPLLGGNRTVGCHVLIQDATGKLRHAIVPACSPCNLAKKPFNIRWLCEAVTIVDPDRKTFVGKIMLPKEQNTPTSRHWVEIIDVLRENSTGKLTIWGKTNMQAKDDKTVIKKVYTNPEDFLWELAVMWNGEGMQSRKMIRKNDSNFIAEVFECNVKRYPGRNQRAYKETYGVCTVQGCHRYVDAAKMVTDGTNICPLHSKSEKKKQDRSIEEAFAVQLGFGEKRSGR